MTWPRERLALLTGIAWAVVAHAKAIDPAKLGQVRRIGIVAVLGDQVSVEKIGFTIFNNRYFQLPSDTWNLDGVAIRQATEVLGKRFIVEPVAYDKAAFDPDPEQSPNFLIDGRSKAAVAALPKSDIDAYLLIQRARYSLPYPSNQWIQGLGLLKGGELLGARSGFQTAPLLYAEYWVTLMDAKTGKVIGDQFATISMDGKLTTYWGAQTPQDPVDWVDKAETMTDAQKLKLRDDLAALVKESITDTLEAMGLAAEPSSKAAPAP